MELSRRPQSRRTDLGWAASSPPRISRNAPSALSLHSPTIALFPATAGIDALFRILLEIPEGIHFLEAEISQGPTLRSRLILDTPQSPPELGHRP